MTNGGWMSADAFLSLAEREETDRAARSLIMGSQIMAPIEPEDLSAPCHCGNPKKNHRGAHRGSKIGAPRVQMPTPKETDVAKTLEEDAPEMGTIDPPKTVLDGEAYAYGDVVVARDEAWDTVPISGRGPDKLVHPSNRVVVIADGEVRYASPGVTVIQEVA